MNPARYSYQIFLVSPCRHARAVKRKWILYEVEILSRTRKALDGDHFVVFITGSKARTRLFLLRSENQTVLARFRLDWYLARRKVPSPALFSSRKQWRYGLLLYQRKETYVWKTSPPLIWKDGIRSKTDANVCRCSLANQWTHCWIQNGRTTRKLYLHHDRYVDTNEVLEKTFPLE